MKESEFRHYAQAYGAQISRWPDAVQADALALRETSWARDILAEAAEADALFEALPVTVAPRRVGASIARVNARIDAQKTPGWHGLWRWFALQGAGVATAGVLGVFVAVATAGTAPSDSEAISQLFALTLSFSDSAFVTGLGDFS